MPDPYGCRIARGGWVREAVGARGYALDESDLWAVIIYNEQLRRADRDEFAEQILGKYRSSLGNTPQDERQLRILDSIAR